MKELNDDRIRVKKSLKIKLKVEAAKQMVDLGEYVDALYKFYKQNYVRK